MEVPGQGMSLAAHVTDQKNQDKGETPQEQPSNSISASSPSGESPGWCST